jgi:hypothetical protein
VRALSLSLLLVVYFEQAPAQTPPKGQSLGRSIDVATPTGGLSPVGLGLLPSPTLRPSRSPIRTTSVRRQS